MKVSVRGRVRVRVSVRVRVRVGVRANYQSHQATTSRKPTWRERVATQGDPLRTYHPDFRARILVELAVEVPHWLSDQTVVARFLITRELDAVDWISGVVEQFAVLNLACARARACVCACVRVCVFACLRVCVFVCVWGGGGVSVCVWGCACVRARV